MIDFYKNKQRLADIFRQTIDIVNIGYYKTVSGEIVALDSDQEMRENSRFYSTKFTVNDIPCKTD